MTEEFVVDDATIAELDRAVAKIDDQKPKDRLEYTIYASRNFAACSEWCRAVGLLCGDISIAQRANAELIQAQYMASVELAKVAIGLLKAHMTAVPTLPASEKEKKVTETSPVMFQ